MTDTSRDGSLWTRLGALYRRVTGQSPSDDLAGLPAGPGAGPLTRDGALPSRIGPYTVTGKLGIGGMGIVYAGRDERLDRRVALKVMGTLGGDERARRRFWREARSAAGVNHPNICQIYEIGEDEGEPFIAMELLEGEPLDDRLQRGPLGAHEAVAVLRDILAALGALHARGIVHRDLKPSNVFLTPHGTKLLDFGLAQPLPEATTNTATRLTTVGVAVGTPRYMAPEQARGEEVDARADLFATGAIGFEMLSGQPAFKGDTVVDVLHATLHEQPPALTGSPAILAIDRVIRCALAKRPADRPSSAVAMAEALATVTGLDGTTPILARALTRLVVLPFRILKPDTESDFLAFSLPDAISMSLSRIDTLIVRSSATASKFAAEAPDLRSVAAEADVDRVVVGTLLRSGDQIRVVAQLVEPTSGTLLGSHTVQSSMGDLFRLQDDLARHIVDSLSLPLTGAPSPSPDAPSNPHAYELYLRANELARTYDGLVRARELYQQSIELDPGFALAWAHLGRCHRVIGKYIVPTPDSEVQARAAVERALELNPRLTVGHKLLAMIECETGQSLGALQRLLRQVEQHGNDPELFAGLVHVCRYCGLFDEALAAHREARRLDPNIPTSYDQTLLVAGNIDRLVASKLPDVVAGADDGIRVIGLGLAGRRDEARRALDAMSTRAYDGVFRAWVLHLRAWLDADVTALTSGIGELSGLKIMDDPEAIFQEGWLLCDVGAHELGLPQLARAVNRSYFVAPTLASRPQFDALRGRRDFELVLTAADRGRRQALEAFRASAAARVIAP